MTKNYIEKHALFKSRIGWISGGIFFIFGSFITYLFKNFCFDTCPSSIDVLKVFLIFGVGGFIIGFLIGGLINILIRR